jgi:hypothetical protein
MHVMRALVVSCALVTCQCELRSGGCVVVSGACLLRLKAALNTLSFKVIKRVVNHKRNNVISESLM